MSESSQASGRNVPATPEPSPQNPDVVSKNVTVNTSKSTWMCLYVPTSALNGPKKLPLVVYYHHKEFLYVHEFCKLMARDLNVVVASPSYRLAPEHPLPAVYQVGVDALVFISTSEDEWIKSYADISNVYLMGIRLGGNLAYNVGIRAYLSSQDATQKKRQGKTISVPIRGLILHRPFFGGQEHCEFEINVNLTVNIIRQLGWKVLVSGIEGDPMVDRQSGCAKLMREKGVDVTECFTDANVSELPRLFASITSLIHSSAP